MTHPPKPGRPGCAPLFRAPTSPRNRRDFPELHLAVAPGALAPARPRPRAPGRLASAAGRAPSSRSPPSLSPAAAARRTPTWLPGRARAAAGTPKPRATRTATAAAGVGTAARAAPTLPPESGVEHSASPRGANEEDTHGNSTTYLPARNRRPRHARTPGTGPVRPAPAPSPGAQLGSSRP